MKISNLWSDNFKYDKTKFLKRHAKNVSMNTLPNAVWDGFHALFHNAAETCIFKRMPWLCGWQSDLVPCPFSTGSVILAETFH